VQVRDGPAAVRGGALPPEATGREVGKAVGEGAPSQKTCRAPDIPNPSRKEDSLSRRTLALVATIVAALVLTGSALAARVTVRVEGKTQTIFGSLPVTVEADNALQALDQASILGEFYYGLTSASFGDYVSQIGKYPATGSSGWVFKVDNVSPPVGADKVVLKDGDSVLWYWADFGPNGGPPTLLLAKSGATGNCYRVTAFDDMGKLVPAAGVVLHVDGRRVKAQGATGGAVGCVGKHRGLVRAYSFGTIRSNSAK